MTKIFDELWYGNIEPCAECKTPTKEMQELEHYIERHKKQLAESMTDEQKVIFEKFEDCLNELNEIVERRIFSYAFKMGSRIAIGTLDD